MVSTKFKIHKRVHMIVLILIIMGYTKTSRWLNNIYKARRVPLAPENNFFQVQLFFCESFFFLTLYIMYVMHHKTIANLLCVKTYAAITLILLIT